MASFLSTDHLARASSRHPWTVIGTWIALVIVAGVVTVGLGLHTSMQLVLQNDPESQQGWDLLEAHALRGERPAIETVIITSKSPDAVSASDEGLTVDDPQFRATVERVTEALRQKPDLVDPNSVTNYYELSAQNPEAASGLVSADKRTTIIPATLVGSLDTAIENAPDFLATLEEQAAAAPAGLELLQIGDATLNEEITRISEEDLAQGEAVGVPIAFIILIIVFGALVAAILPLVLAIAAIAVAFGLAALVSQAAELSFIVANMITMIGLAVGIDYSLFVIERYREERRHGIAKMEAIVAAGRTAGRAVFFSGMTVVFALLGMFLVPNNIYRSLSVGAILVVVVAVVACLTLIPALLALIGDRVNWPRRRRFDAQAVAAADRFDAQEVHGGFWGSITRVVMANPVISVIAAVLLLVAAASPYLDFQSGLLGASGLPEETEARAAFDVLAADFQAGLVAPVEIVVEGGDPAAVQQGVNNLVAALSDETIANEQGNAEPLFGAPTTVQSQDGQITFISIPMNIAPDAPAAYEVIERLREVLVPAAFAETSGVDVFVTGQTANNADFFAITETYTPIVFVFVLGLSFLLLLVAFRSIVVPITAIIMNLLSVGAAYGLLVFVFQQGHGADFFGFQQTPTIEAWLPLFLFTVLFGLSMDYHVFLLSRIREHYAATGNNHLAVAVGLHATARIITGAALIMVAVFAGFASGRLVTLQQTGFGLGVAVLLDATIVRSVLVPATMALLGDRNWYLPSWLNWLPDLRIEGTTPAPPVPEPGVGVAPAD